MKGNQRLSTMHRQALDLQLLREFSRQLAVLEPQAILERLAQLLQQTREYQDVAIGVIENDDLVFRAVAAPDRASDSPPERQRLDESGLAAWVARHAKPVVIGNPEEASRYPNRGEHRDGRSRLIVPLGERPNVLGIIDIQSERANAFDDHDLELMTTLAEYTALALNHALLRDSERGRWHEIERLQQTERLLFADMEQSYNELLVTLSELDQRDEQLRRSERLNALGQLAAGIAHDFNNLLVGIIGNAEFLLDDEADDARRQALLVIAQAAQDGAAIVRRIQQFARQSEHRAGDLVLLSDIIDGALALTRPRWHNLARREGRAITLQREIDVVPVVQGSAAELRELLVNLILNAIDAMPEGGELCVRLLREQEHSIGAAAPSTATQMAIIEVSDNGIGMSLEQQARVFEMFYSTKPSTKGSGIGLALCRQIVERHGGSIELESAPARGTTFRILLPVANQPAAEPRPSEALASPARLRILVVDDDPSVRDVLMRMLQREGHAVAAMSTAQEVLSQFAAGAYDLIFSELVLADMDGASLLRQLRAADSRLLAVIITGWSEAELASELVMGASAVLTKPFNLAELRRVMRELTQSDGV